MIGLVDKWQVFGFGCATGAAACVLAMIIAAEVRDRHLRYKRRKVERAALKYGRHSAGQVTEVKQRVETAVFPAATTSARPHRPRSTPLANRTDTTEFPAVSASQTNRQNG